MPVKVNVMVAGKPLEVNICAEGDAEEATQTDPNSDDFVCRNVGELRNFVNDMSNYDGQSMKLIFKGKMISHDAADELTKYGFKNGDRLMGLGKPKTELTEDKGLHELKKFEREQLVKLVQTYDAIKTDMEGLEKNFLNAEMTEEMIQRLWKRVSHFADVSEKHLISIDGIKIFDDDTPDPIRQRNREVRKTMINGVQDYLNFNDKFKFRLEQLRESLKDRE